MKSLRAQIVEEAKALGFDKVGIANAGSDPTTTARLKQFLGNDYHGSMEWMADTAERRSDPTTLWPDARSIIMVAMNYGPETDPLSALEDRERGTISVYARHRDYHDVVKGKLKTLASKIISRAGEGDVKVFVDTAPVMEKPLAAKAGLGWQGKHTNLVSRELGSWFFLGSIFTTLDLEPDDAEVDHCGSCSNCLDVCPTDAFPAPYELDARRCISYLTIENKGPIPAEFRKAIGNRIFGCDDCLAVCPWNKFAGAATEMKLASPPEPLSKDLEYFLAFDDAVFRSRFSGSPVKRIGRNRFIRNCLVAAGNSEKPEMVSSVEPHLRDADPLVRGAAVWALGELVQDAAERYEKWCEIEVDDTVLGEWNILKNGEA